AAGRLPRTRRSKLPFRTARPATRGRLAAGDRTGAEEARRALAGAAFSLAASLTRERHKSVTVRQQVRALHVCRPRLRKRRLRQAGRAHISSFARRWGANQTRR